MSQLIHMDISFISMHVCKHFTIKKTGFTNRRYGDTTAATLVRHIIRWSYINNIE